jgi:hypothetical protein
MKVTPRGTLGERATIALCSTMDRWSNKRTHQVNELFSLQAFVRLYAELPENLHKAAIDGWWAAWRVAIKGCVR